MVARSSGVLAAAVVATVAACGRLDFDSRGKAQSACEARGGAESTIDVQGAPWRVHAFAASDVLVVTCAGDALPIEYLVVGGGAGAKSDPTFYHSGGGGGAVVTGATTLAAGEASITVGRGGAETMDGEASSAFGVVAGGGASTHASAGFGGASGASTAGGASSRGGCAGGGGGAGGAGGNADWGDGNSYFWGGRGGVGVTSDITGEALGYGGGGSGQGWHFNTNGFRIQNGVRVDGDYRALGVDGGATAVHCPLGGPVSTSYCMVPLESVPPRPHSGGGGADVYAVVGGAPARGGADGVVVVRYPL